MMPAQIFGKRGEGTQAPAQRKHQTITPDSVVHTGNNHHGPQLPGLCPCYFSFPRFQH